MINASWDFREAVNNIKAIKDKYTSLLSSFSIYECKQKGIMIHEVRKEIYELQFEEWKKDKLWEFMNGDIPYILLKSLIRQK